MEPGCPVIVERGRCATHARPSRVARGYGNRWARRARKFRDEYPLCGMRPGRQAPVMSACYDARRVTLGTLVDHVVPHRGNRDLFWDALGNWQTLCAACHARKSRAGR